jgi:hypothetical protein
MQINSFTHFRAVSILFIVASHSYGAAGMKLDNLFDMSIKNLLSVCPVLSKAFM